MRTFFCEVLAADRVSPRFAFDPFTAAACPPIVLTIWFAPDPYFCSQILQTNISIVVEIEREDNERLSSLLTSSILPLLLFSLLRFLDPFRILSI